ncbi:MAG: TM0106 family RecB-like putative nuclease [Actinomycetota bacterium]
MSYRAKVVAGRKTVYLDEQGLVYSPTDLTKFLACRHLTSLDLAVALEELAAPQQQQDEALELLFRKGLDHEQRYLTELRAAHRIVEIETKAVGQAATETETAMRDGADVIYQAAFLHNGSRGHADFLLRTDKPSALGGWSYDVADTKLARRLKVPALLQMAEYGRHLLRLQGTPPQWLTVVAGDGTHHPYRYADVEAYARHAAGRLNDFVRHRPAATAEPVAHCRQCRWIARCTAGWRRQDHLSYVAFLRADHRHELEQHGIRTVAQLAELAADELPRSVGRTSRERLVAQARLQMTERRTGAPAYELLEPAAGMGLLRLPAPDPDDVYLDFEGDPFADPSGREYLAGLIDRAGDFTALWAHSADAERQLTEQLVDQLLARWQRNPGMHVYHYASYEKSALQRLTARHGVREAELDILLRAEVLVDLYAVVRQGLRISKESYSLKKLEAYYWGEVRGAGEVADAMSSVLAYERWLVEGGDHVLEDIEAYNRDDVRSTLALHEWLEDRRTELEVKHSQVFARSESGPMTVQPQPSDAELAEAALATRLVEAGHPLLAALVGWHRREARPAWWDVFRLEDLDDEELIDDGAAIGGLSLPEYRGDIVRSQVYRYRFPPQDTKIRVGEQALDVDRHQPIGTVIDLDPAGGWLEVKIARTREPAIVRGVGPDKPRDEHKLRDAIAGVAQRVLAGSDCLGDRLLRRVVPASLPVQNGERPADAVIRLGSWLRGEVLAVQGPPGTGKSTAGAQLVRALLDDGLRVGVTALSHQVIGNLLWKIGRPALQKCEDDDWCGAALVEHTKDNAQVVAALTSRHHRLVGGTAWLWAREEMADTVDVLVVDEAGQFALANAVAASGAARSMVLLGDPQQLPQPAQAAHPHGAGASALEHLLDGNDTIPADQGVFLDTTWRMHPQITDLVSTMSYDGRLRAGSGLHGQRVVGSALAGSGLRWVPVEHAGNESASDEEARVVADLVADVLHASWVDERGEQDQIGPEDVLVVAAYNAHVARLRRVLPGDIEVGTVDKFQGREAAVVIYSLASSSADDAPRGVEFLYDLNRLNVAVSRARAVSIVVGSPRLLDAEARDPHQLRLVNALCRYVQSATAMR